jgi:hypothetical protein
LPFRRRMEHFIHKGLVWSFATTQCAYSKMSGGTEGYGEEPSALDVCPAGVCLLSRCVAPYVIQISSCRRFDGKLRPSYVWQNFTSSTSSTAWQFSSASAPLVHPQTKQQHPQLSLSSFPSVVYPYSSQCLPQL